MSHSSATELLEIEQEISRRWSPFYDRVFSHLHLADLRRRLAAAVGSADLVLDLGAGPGCMKRAFAGRARVVSLDVSRDILLAADDEARSRAVVAAAQALPFRRHAFDAVVGFHFLHHLADVGEVIRAALDALKPGGVLAFVEPTVTVLDPRPWLGRLARLPVSGVVRVLRKRYRSMREIAARDDLGMRSEIHDALDPGSILDLFGGVADLRTEPIGFYSSRVGEIMYGEAAWERPLFRALRTIDARLLRYVPRLAGETLIVGRNPRH
jgi:SAM-dependent methyltransferase